MDAKSMGLLFDNVFLNCFWKSVWNNFLFQNLNIKTIFLIIHYKGNVYLLYIMSNLSKYFIFSNIFFIILKTILRKKKNVKPLENRSPRA